MIPPELRSRMWRMFFAEHWKIGTIAAELVYPGAAVGEGATVRPRTIGKSDLAPWYAYTCADCPEIGNGQRREALIARAKRLLTEKADTT